MKNNIILFLFIVVVVGVGLFMNEQFSLTEIEEMEKSVNIIDTEIFCNSESDCLTKYGDDWNNVDGFCEITCKINHHHWVMAK